MHVSPTPTAPLSCPLSTVACGNGFLRLPRPAISSRVIRCASSAADDGGKKASARLSQVQQLLQEAEERALSADTGPTPKITLGA